MTRRLRRSRFSRPVWTISIAAALAVIGFVGAAQWNSSLARQQFVTSAQQILINEADQLLRQQEELLAQIEEAEGRVQEFQERTAGSQTEIDQLNQALAAARLATGLGAMRGPGAVIEIADSTRQVPVNESQTNYLVLVDDLRDIVTALWASGAEGISISGGAAEGGPPAERLVATSSIYGAGMAILVNAVPLSPPYRIEAIGPDGLHERFLTHPIFLPIERRIQNFGLQFASEPRDEITLPAYVGDARLKWGAPVEEPD